MAIAVVEVLCHDCMICRDVGQDCILRAGF
jgi:hypothetical protein